MNQQSSMIHHQSWTINDHSSMHHWLWLLLVWFFACVLFCLCDYLSLCLCDSLSVWFFLLWFFVCVILSLCDSLSVWFFVGVNVWFLVCCQCDVLSMCLCFFVCVIHRPTDRPLLAAAGRPAPSDRPTFFVRCVFRCFRCSDRCFFSVCSGLLFRVLFDWLSLFLFHVFVPLWVVSPRVRLWQIYRAITSCFGSSHFPPGWPYFFFGRHCHTRMGVHMSTPTSLVVVMPPPPPPSVKKGLRSRFVSYFWWNCAIVSSSRENHRH